MQRRRHGKTALGAAGVKHAGARSGSRPEQPSGGWTCPFSRPTGTFRPGGRAGRILRGTCALAAGLTALAGGGMPAAAEGLPSASSVRFQLMHRPDTPFGDSLWIDPAPDRIPDRGFMSASLREVYALLGPPVAVALPKAAGGAGTGLLSSSASSSTPAATSQPEPEEPAPVGESGATNRKRARNRVAGLAERLALPERAQPARIEAPPGFAAVDLHVHTWYSPDSAADPERMLRAAAQRGLAGIAVTDHNTVAGAERAQALAAQLKANGALPASFLVIKGEEVGSRDGHIVGLFLRAAVPPGLTAEETIAAIHAQGGLAIAAHPLLRSGVGARAAALPFDAVEVENIAEELHFSLGSAAANRRRTGFYRAITNARVGSSDAHDPSVVGLGYTLVPTAALDEASLRQALAAHETRAGMLAPARHLRRVAEATARPAGAALREFHRLLAPGNRALRGMTGADWASLRPGLLHGSFGWSLRLSRRF